jgi:hypothetical protein
MKPEKKPRKSRHGEVACTRRVTIALTEAEWAAVVELAGAGKVPVAVWARNAVVEAALTRADHARQVVAHLEVVGGMPSATWWFPALAAGAPSMPRRP